MDVQVRWNYWLDDEGKKKWDAKAAEGKTVSESDAGMSMQVGFDNWREGSVAEPRESAVRYPRCNSTFFC